MLILDTKNEKQVTVTNGMFKFILRFSPETITKLAECEKQTLNAKTAIQKSIADQKRSELFATIFGF